MADIHGMVFSKDRAMQLDAFLRSTERHAPYEVVVNRAQGDDFDPSVRAFLREHERVVFHTDDEVFYRTPPPELFADEDAVACLHLGRNTTYCYTHAAAQAIPAHFPRWRWRDAEHDFAYPLSVNGCVFHSADILPLLDFTFTDPTQFEAGIAYRAAQFRLEWMVAPEHSCTVALPHNRVSASSGCAAGSNPDWQPDALNARYLDGWRIDLDAMDWSNVTAAHQEIALEFTR